MSLEEQHSVLDILVVAPHPDDAELGMAGTIVRCREEGQKIGILDLTDGEPTPHGSRATRQRETATASEVLGVQWRENLGLTNRSLEATLDNRRELAGVFRRVRPRWLFAPFWVDAHPDHTAATQLVEAARFWAKLSKSDLPGVPHFPERIWYYCCVHLPQAIQPAFIVDISRQWEAKQAALECYHSQFVAGREALEPGFIERQREAAAYWGSLIGVRYGEPFASRQPVGLTGLGTLV